MNDTPLIIILGEPTAADLQLITTQSGLLGLAIRCIRALKEADFKTAGDKPDGYISFLPPARDSLLNAFVLMPVAGQDEVHFYQAVPPGGTPDFLNDFPISGVFTCPLSEGMVWNMLKGVLTSRSVAARHSDLIGEIVKYRKQKQQLITIGTSLSSQDNLYNLLETILWQTREMLCADAACIYLRERNPATQSFLNTLRFKVMQNDSVSLPHEEFSIPINQDTIAGYVADTVFSLNIDDVYLISPDKPYRHGKSFDQRFGYRTKSMLTVPLKNTEGQVVGILQLMNKKTGKEIKLSSAAIADETVLPFTLSDEDFVLSIASQAAVTIDRMQLHEDIQQIFEGFLSSSSAAIDERDHVTAGHSKRVMGYALTFVNTIKNDPAGPFAGEDFSNDRVRQFKFAALLHDMGKIGVPEALLTKESRITAGEMEALQARLEYIGLLKNMPAYAGKIPWESAAAIQADGLFLQKINASGFLSDDDFKTLGLLRDKFYFTAAGEKRPLLSDAQWEALSVRKGNLTDAERDKINSHAASTRRILSKIPWTATLKDIPQIAAHHHEKIDGSGYPDGLTGNQICLESKILAVVDIYEALVAQDRPYKRAKTPEQALGILKAEVAANHLDKTVVDYFIDKGIYKIFSNDK
ncbi:MAG: GAF domain-containing protein [Chitinivibrionales bacterium]|nr:GAF domain-containing protein [Chitinivibrionales bacterium]